MRLLPQALLLAGAAAIAPGVALAQDRPHSFSGKVGLYSEYEYRGISQTAERPAVQLNLDYEHASGFYAGTFLSNIRWLKVAAEESGFSSSANIEWDLYLGYRREIAKDVTVDVGYLRYEYPRSGAFSPKPNTDEVYAGIGYGPMSLKYSYAFSDTFGVPDSEGSDFIEANLTLPVVENVTFTGHIGRQRYRNSGELDYTVWKIGAVYDFGNGLNAGAYYKGTDADPGLYTYKGKDWGGDRLVAFVTYSF
jgi:uncharacterized protein (TIGR02001 family)